MRQVLWVFCLLLSVGCSWAASDREDDVKSLGTGLWVYTQLTDVAPEAMADKAVKYGINSVRLKVHDGKQVFRLADKVPAVAKAMRARGIKVLVWGYNYADSPAEEAALICSYLDKPWVDGYVYNTERDLKNKSEATKILAGKVSSHRANCQICNKKLLGFAPFALISRHSSLDYSTLVENTDFVEPQIYWATRNVSVSKAFMDTYRDWLAWEKKSGRKKPMVPLGQTYDATGEHGRAVLPGEVVDFGKRTKRYFAVSFYAWPGRESLWSELAQVSRLRKEFKGGGAKVTVSQEDLDRLEVEDQVHRSQVPIHSQEEHAKQPAYQATGSAVTEDQKLSVRTSWLVYVWRWLWSHYWIGFALWLILYMVSSAIEPYNESAEFRRSAYPIVILIGATLPIIIYATLVALLVLLALALVGSLAMLVYWAVVWKRRI